MEAQPIAAQGVHDFCFFKIRSCTYQVLSNLDPVFSAVIPDSHGKMYRVAIHANDARKALKMQACPGIGHVRVAPLLL